MILVTRAESDAPRRIRPQQVAERFDTSSRTAAVWIGKMKVAGVIKKVGGILVARWTAIDAWVASGGEMPATKRGGK